MSSPTPTTLIRNGEVFHLAATGVTTRREDVRVAGTRIVAVGPDLPIEAGDTVIEAAGRLVLPGLINGHFHSPVNHMKGSLDSLPLEIFMLWESPHHLADALPSPREAYVRTLLAAVEMLRLGVTAVQDDAFFVPHPTPDVVDAVMQAYTDVGIRARVALDQPNVPELIKLPHLAEILPPALRDELAVPPAFDEAALLDAYARHIERWHDTAEGRIRVAVSCSAPQRVTPSYFAALDDLSKRHDLPFYAHMLETKVQRVLGRTRFQGRSLVRYTADLGLLSDRMNLIHGIWLDEADMALIAEAGTVIAHNPISNLRLGSGIMPFRALREHGIPICLGSDEAIADDTVDMWGVAKAAGLVHNLTDVDWERWPKAHEVLDCLFTGGARAMREADRLGAIEPGREADLVLLDLDSLPFTPLNDLARQLLYCGAGSAVRLTMVAGKVVFDGERVVGIDEKALRAEVRALFAARADVAAATEAEARHWLPWYREMTLRAHAEDVGLTRRLER
jgi:cytosine/adenosine deaminase-related metal-dependent hydrolase